LITRYSRSMRRIADEAVWKIWVSSR
jgi:hypothetical protein